MAQLTCIPGTPTDNTKPKVYLFCRSLLRERHVESLIQAILACRDCDIFWAEAPIPTQERPALLADMQLFILPVDFTLLTEPSEEIESDIAFAVQNHISLLPVLMEPDIYPIYSLPHKFGDMPCLRYCKEPDSFVPFPDALRLAFGSLLPSEVLLTEASVNLKALPASSRKDLLRGIAIYYGINRGKDSSKGLKLMHKAANAGCADANILLLRIYTHGIGIPANRQQALHFASRLVKNFEVLESVKLPEQLPDYFLDIAHLCSCVDRQDLTVKLASRLMDSLYYTLGESHELTRLYRDVLIAYCRRYRRDDQWMLELCNKQYWAACQQHNGTHPEALERLRRVAYYSDKVGDAHNALEYYRDIYAAYRETLGEHAEETLSALSDVAAQCLRMTQNQHARELSELAYNRFLGVKGRHYPATLEALEVLCDALFGLDKTRELLRFLRQLHAGCRLSLGKLHPRTLQATTKLALASMKARQKVRAVRTITEAYNGYQQLYGAEHPKTVETKELMEYMKRSSEEEDT